MRDLDAARLSAKEALFRAHDEAEKKFFTMLMIVIIICTVAIIAVFGIFAFGENNYRQGQIDALSGKVYYELAKQTDGSVIWTKKDTK